MPRSYSYGRHYRQAHINGAGRGTATLTGQAERKNAPKAVSLQRWSGYESRAEEGGGFSKRVIAIPKPNRSACGGDRRGRWKGLAILEDYELGRRPV